MNRIATLLGGRAAEAIIFGDVSTGAHNDLARATDIARSMIKEYGMSSQVGQVYFAREKRALFMEMGAPEGGDYSEATAELIDREIKSIIDGEYGKAKSVLWAKRMSSKRERRSCCRRRRSRGRNSWPSWMATPRRHSLQRDLNSGPNQKSSGATSLQEKKNRRKTLSGHSFHRSD